MNLLIDTISSPSVIILFDQNRDIIGKNDWIAQGNESSTLIPKIDDFISANNLIYWDIENIVVVAGPWSFTWVRTTVLVANTLAFTLGCHLTSLSYFDLFKNYPIMRPSSKRDYFVRFSQNSDIEIIENNDLLEQLKNKNIKRVYGQKSNVFPEDITIVEKIDYKSIIHKVIFKQNHQIDPLYIKKPNIS